MSHHPNKVTCDCNSATTRHALPPAGGDGLLVEPAALSMLDQLGSDALKLPGSVEIV